MCVPKKGQYVKHMACGITGGAVVHYSIFGLHWFPYVYFSNLLDLTWKKVDWFCLNHCEGIVCFCPTRSLSTPTLTSCGGIRGWHGHTHPTLFIPGTLPQWDPSSRERTHAHTECHSWQSLGIRCHIHTFSQLSSYRPEKNSETFTQTALNRPPPQEIHHWLSGVSKCISLRTSDVEIIRSDVDLGDQCGKHCTVMTPSLQQMWIKKDFLCSCV